MQGGGHGVVDARGAVADAVGGAYNKHVLKGLGLEEDLKRPFEDVSSLIHSIQS